MTYDPLKRDSSWQMVCPGCWVDPAGHGHIFPDELLAYLSIAHPEAGFDPSSKSDYDMIVSEFAKMLEQQHPGMRFIIAKHQRLEN